MVVGDFWWSLVILVVVDRCLLLIIACNFSSGGFGYWALSIFTRC